MLKMFLAILFIMLVSSAAKIISAAPLDDLITAAKKEGRVEFFAAGTLGAEGARKLDDAFNKKYGFNLKTVYHRSSGMARDIGKVITIASAGLPAEWDVMLVTDSHHASLWLKKVQQHFDYAKVGVPPQLIQYDGGAVVLAHGFVLPAYHKKFLPPEEAPSVLGRSSQSQVEGG